MKRLLAIFLALALCAAAGGCGSREEEKQDHPSRKPEPETSPAAAVQSQPTQAPGGRFDSFDPLTVADTQDYTIILTAGEFPEPGICRIYATLTNKTQDTTLTYRIRDALFNGVSTYYSRQQDVEPGQTCQVEYELDFQFLLRLELGEITDVALDYVVAPAETMGQWQTWPTVHLYPQGPEAAVTYRWKPELEGVVLFDNAYGMAVIIGYESWIPELYPLSVLIYCENRTDREMAFSGYPLVNGESADIWYIGVDAKPGCAGVMEISWSLPQLETIGISDPETQVRSMTLPLEMHYKGEPDNLLAQETVTLLKGETLQEFTPE